MRQSALGGDAPAWRHAYHDGPLRSGERDGAAAAITGDGRRVFAGGLDAVDVCGIDRRVGGTHLVPGAVWRWDGSALAAPSG